MRYLLLILIAFILSCASIFNKKMDRRLASETECPTCSLFAPSLDLKTALGISGERFCAEPDRAICENPPVSSFVNRWIERRDSEEKEFKEFALMTYAERKGDYRIGTFLVRTLEERGLSGDADLLKKYFMNGNLYFSGSELKFPAKTFCEDQKTSLIYSSVSTKEQFDQFETRHSRFLDTVRPTLERLAKDVPLAFLEALSERCEDWRKTLYPKVSDGSVPSELSADVKDSLMTLYSQSACMQPNSIRALAIQVARKTVKPSDPGLLSFISSNLAILMFDRYPSSSQWEGWTKKAMLAQVSVGGSCAAMELLSKTYVTNLRQEVQREALLDVRVLQRFFDNHYSPAMAAATDRIFDVVKKALVKAVAESGIPQESQSPIITSYGPVQILHPTMASLREASQGNQLNLLSLNPEDPLLMFLQWDSLFDVNAAYLPSVQKIILMPGYLSMVQYNPLDLALTLAHELGHHIDGYPINESLKPFYAKLVGCLSREDSIGLRVVQRQEAIADFWATQTFPYLVQGLGDEDFRHGLVASQIVYCAADVGRPTHMFQEDHPHPLLRIAGIHSAANYSRKAFGCGPTPRPYVACGLQGVIP